MGIVCKNLVSVNHQSENSTGTHSHRHHEMVYCLEGKGTAEIEGKSFSFSTGNYYITKKHTSHGEKTGGGTRIIYFYFDAPDELVSAGMFSDFDGNILSYVKKLRTESGTHSILRDEMMQCLIKTILIETLRSNESAKPGFDAVIQYIDENMENGIDFKFLARKLHYSYERFRHLFKEHTGLSPNQYLIRQRIEKAKFLMKMNPDACVTEISYNCGFPTSSHFAKAFRAKEGMSPSEYFKKQKS